ncbi:hypothetical protein GALMADRAFT_255533 [Galerina marginata CBS 339.88]|uniref:Uncharacterized protein n=1 Tax=Galerina marginata (strain CBS 339.88) TaxID=685588 RepID=A0A067SSJ0_GALM3|nr:hypothetical protein GALMADRAFT_255533 [Galerina marginata CBS 339.88]
MGDLSSGLAYLCCCLKHSDVSADGSRFGSGKKADPRERQIDQEFLARNYHRDSTGHFHVQPTPTSSMFPRQLSEQSKHSAEKDEKKPKEKKRFFGLKAPPEALELTPPKLALTDSTSAESKETGLSGENDAADSPELLVTPPTA